MKKYKVMFVTLSAVLKDGSRSTLMEEEICSCKNRGMAEIIYRSLKEDCYRELLSIKNDNTPMYLLTVRQ